MPSEKRHTLNWSERYHINRIISNCMHRNADTVCGAAYSTRVILSWAERPPPYAVTSATRPSPTGTPGLAYTNNLRSYPLAERTPYRAETEQRGPAGTG